MTRAWRERSFWGACFTHFSLLAMLHLGSALCRVVKTPSLASTLRAPRPPLAFAISRRAYSPIFRHTAHAGRGRASRSGYRITDTRTW